MPGPNTPILGLVVPTVGGDASIWGNELNGDLAILDNLGAAPSVSFNTATPAVASAFPITIYRGTTGGLAIPLTLPNPATIPGKIFVVKKVDSGSGSISVVGAIDGQSSYVLRNQYAFAWFFSNGGSYDVIAWS